MPSSLTSQLLDIVDSYHFSDDSLKIQSLKQLEQAFVDHLMTDVICQIDESQREQLGKLYDSGDGEKFFAQCESYIPHWDRFVEESIEDFKNFVSL